ncbi:hypothetical protein PanWU01x14_124000 [Parasponia andersonii]|uniref:Uncharacterized protein n=1 Tax=Parasponia andersonii TaxID=3476 RepID=A0A2P5CTZ2_PARAD|nr:hypothetical protein PanWU01x14_124000 [Parasponia andersonii]
MAIKVINEMGLTIRTMHKGDVSGINGAKPTHWYFLKRMKMTQPYYY